MAKTPSAKKRLLVIVTILGVGACIWIASKRVQSLLMLGYVDSAIGRVRTVVAAEDEFARLHPEVGFTCMLSELPRDEQIGRLVKDGTDNGYAFTLAGCRAIEPGKPISKYYITARPLHSRLPAFCSDQSGILKSDPSGSIEKCVQDGAQL